ncbi:MAG: FG-GAP repeat protein [Myxococcota bacterium]
MAAGDVDGDGWTDLAATAKGVSASAGAVYLVLGGTL